jgi:hypothetical protein
MKLEQTLIPPDKFKSWPHSPPLHLARRVALELPLGVNRNTKYGEPGKGELSYAEHIAAGNNGRQVASEDTGKMRARPRAQE